MIPVPDLLPVPSVVFSCHAHFDTRERGGGGGGEEIERQTDLRREGGEEREEEKRERQIE